MIAFIIRSILTAGFLFLTVQSFATGYWGWGIFLIFITAIIGATFIYNENLAFAINHMRTETKKKRRNLLTRLHILICCLNVNMRMLFTCKHC